MTHGHYAIDTLPEIPTRGSHDPDAEDFEALTFSPEEDAKLDRGARPNLIARALAGEAEAMDDLRRLHVTRWEHVR